MHWKVHYDYWSDVLEDLSDLLFVSQALADAQFAALLLQTVDEEDTPVVKKKIVKKAVAEASADEAEAPVVKKMKVSRKPLLLRKKSVIVLHF